MQKRITILSLLLIIAAVVGVVFSSILVYHHYNIDFESPLCGTDQNSGCNLLNRTPVSKFFGIPIATLGIIFYATILFLALYFLYFRHVEYMIVTFVLSCIALIIDAFLFIYSYNMQTFCTFCIITYFCTVAIFVLTFFLIKQKNTYKISLPKPIQQGVPFIYSVIISILLIVSFASIVGLYSNSNNAETISWERLYQQSEKSFIDDYWSKEIWTSQLADNSIIQKEEERVWVLVFLDPYNLLMQNNFSILSQYQNIFTSNIQIDVYYYYQNNECIASNIKKAKEKKLKCSLHKILYCAKLQNKNIQLQSALYQQPETIFNFDNVEKYKNFFIDSGIKLPSFMECLKSNKTEQSIQNNTKTFRELQKNDISNYFINGRSYKELPPISIFSAIMQ